jgi:hypothetical protein
LTEGGDNCVPKTDTKGNERAIGAYCTPVDLGCPSFGSEIRVCSGTFGAPAGAWFCTGSCVADSDCGTGAMCVPTPRGNGCTPMQCLAKLLDAGSVSAQ